MAKEKTKVEIPYNWDPRFYQMDVWDAMDAGVRRVDCVWHRRAGKDLTFINRATVEAHKRIGTYYHMMPKLNQARKVVWDGMDKSGRAFLDYIPKDLIRKRNEAEMQIEFHNGSIWQLVGADNFDNLMGTNPVGLTLSEYSLCNPKSWDFFRPILRENGGWAAFLYTPRGRNHAYDLHVMAQRNPDWFSQVLTVADTGIVSKEDIEDERRSGMSDDMIQQEFYCSFEAAMPGAYYSKELWRAREEGRITRVPYQNTVPVDTWWDLGIDDSMSIWFTQDIGREIHVIWYYENRGEGLMHYAAYLDERIKKWGGFYGKHTAPHDITVREIGSGKTRLLTAGELGIKFEVAQRPAQKEDGIQAVRNIFSVLYFDEENCRQGLDGLASYRSEYDEANKVLKRTPVHDWASHPADSLQTLSLAHEFQSLIKASQDDEGPQTWLM